MTCQGLDNSGLRHRCLRSIVAARALPATVLVVHPDRLDAPVPVDALDVGTPVILGVVIGPVVGAVTSALNLDHLSASILVRAVVKTAANAGEGDPALQSFELKATPRAMLLRRHGKAP